MSGHGGGIGVEVEQPAAALHRGVAVAGVVEPEAAEHPVGRLRRQLHRCAAAWQIDRAPVGQSLDALHSRDGARGEEADQRLAVERRPARQAEFEGAHGTILPGPA